MSTGLNCEFIHVVSGWYYLLEHSNAPKQCWDWREYASGYGPFATFALAHKDLRDHHANPGGFSSPEDESLPDPDPTEGVLADLIADAKARGRRSR